MVVNDDDDKKQNNRTTLHKIHGNGPDMTKGKTTEVIFHPMKLMCIPNPDQDVINLKYISQHYSSGVTWLIN